MAFKDLGFLILLFSISAGCGKYSGLSPDFPTNFEKPNTRADFAYESSYKILEMTRTQRNRDCFINEFVIESSYPQLGGATVETEGLYFVPRGADGPVPVVIVFPPVGGKNPLDQEMAETFCEEKVAAFIPTTDFTGLESPVPPPGEDHNHALFRVVSFVRAVSTFSEDEEGLNSEKLGLMGASLGGILSSFAMSVVPEVSAGFFIAAGGDLPSILAHSRQSKVEKLKRVRYQEQGFLNDGAYEAWLREKLSYDTLDFTDEVPTESVEMILSLSDKSVPTVNQWLLHKAFGEPNVTTSKRGHIQTIFHSLFHERDREEIVEFFQDRFAKKNPRQIFSGVDLLGPSIP